MATNKIVIALDNRVQSGDQSQAEITAALAAAGVANGVAEQIRDPITGKLIQVILTFPDTANQAAIDAVNANRGVATASAPIPPGLFVLNWDNATLVQILKTGISIEQVLFFAAFSPTDPTRGFGAILAQLKGNGIVNTFVPGPVNRDPSVFTNGWFGIVNFHPTSDIVINSGDLVVTTDGVALPILLSAPITVPAHVTFGNGNVKRYWIGADGKLYFDSSDIEGVHSAPTTTYAQAVAAGSV